MAKGKKQGRPSRARQAEETVKTTVRLRRTLWRDARVRAIDDGTDLQTVVSEALAVYLDGGRRRRGGSK